MRYKTTLFFLVLIISFIFAPMDLPGQNQSPVGTWVDSQYNITLTLNADYTYTIQYPQGRSQGRFGVNGQQFCMQDSSGTQQVCYTVLNYTGNLMVLRDNQGVTMNFQRQGAASGPAMPQSQPKAAAPPAQQGTGAVLAQKDGHTLTDTQFHYGLGILQFIIGQSVTPTEVNQLKAKLLEEFNQQPAAVLNQLNGLGQSLQKVRAVSDPATIGVTRQALYTALYQATAAMREDQKPLLIQVMNRYIKALAMDAANGLILTNKDVDGMINYLAFNSQLAGQKVNLTRSLRDSVTAELVKNFPAMALQQKQLLCSASLLWQVLETNWSRLSAAQKQQYKNAYLAQMQQTAAAQSPASYNTGQQYNNTGSGSQTGSKKSLIDQQAEFQARQNMFTMMNNMNLQSHATSLNIIENMGGTGNYWEVVDY